MTFSNITLSVRNLELEVLHVEFSLSVIYKQSRYRSFSVCGRSTATL